MLKRLTPSDLMLLSFAAAILAGAFLLQMPFALRRGSLDFLDALFTAASAVCVTGLAVKDTGAFFSLQGQIVLLVLVQLGGVGILTMSVFLLQRMGWSVASRYREAIAGGFLPHARVSFREILNETVRLTVVVESAGAALLFVGFYARTGDAPASAGYAVFHAVSAFCNAGFSVFPDNLMSYRGDLCVNGTVMALIVAGGIGFFVLRDIRANLLVRPGGRRSRKSLFQRLSIQSRIVLLFSLALTGGGALVFFLLERWNALRGMPFRDAALCSLFQSVTARTAGFNTVDIGHLSNPTLFLLVLLMFIGASPGGTGGGIKVTTFATLMIVLYSRLRGRPQAQFFQRALPGGVVQRTVTLFILSVGLVSVCLILLLTVELRGVSHPESRGMFLELLFEAVSAFGTVGLSTGVTPHLSPAGKMLLVALMYVGRLGPLTLAASLEKRARDPGYRLPEETIMIG